MLGCQTCIPKGCLTQVELIGVPGAMYWEGRLWSLHGKMSLELPWGKALLEKEANTV